ncbi:MAG: triphosphoribosyl-dephospho-CoA synthase [Candidatus Caldarchaeum sp.]
MYTAEYVANCCTSALLLELATTPKPGLVDRSSDPQIYAEFVLSAISLHQQFLKASSHPVGKLALKACSDMLRWQRGGNTHLGSLLLLLPLSKAACHTGKFNQLRRNLRNMLRRMDHRDLANILNSIKIVNPGALGRVAYLDAHSTRTSEVIRLRRIPVVEGLKPYVKREVVAHEYVTGYDASFVHGYSFMKQRLELEDWNSAGINTFLNILKHLPDSHISRRRGYQTSVMFSKLAGRILDAGGFSTHEGRQRFRSFCELVRRTGVKPAATADLLAVSYCLVLLEGWRP